MRSTRPSAAAHCHPDLMTTFAYGRSRQLASFLVPPRATMPTTVSPVTGCGSTPAFTTDDEIVPLSRSADTVTSPWSPATSFLKSSMLATGLFNRACGPTTSAAPLIVDR